MMFSCDSDNDNESTNANAVKSLNINPYEDPLGYKKENISSTGKKGDILHLSGLPALQICFFYHGVSARNLDTKYIFN